MRGTHPSLTIREHPPLLSVLTLIIIGGADRYVDPGLIKQAPIVISYSRFGSLTAQQYYLKEPTASKTD